MPRWEVWPCHCDLILTPPCTHEKDGSSQRGHFTMFSYSQAGRMAKVKPTLNHILLSIYVWFEALKSFHVDSRVPGWACHCYLKSAIFDPLCTREKGGRGQSGPKSCFPINIDVIRRDKEFLRWFQGPLVTLPLWPDFDSKISHFWHPRAQAGRVAGVKAALNHVFPLI